MVLSHRVVLVQQGKSSGYRDEGEREECVSGKEWGRERKGRREE